MVEDKIDILIEDFIYDNGLEIKIRRPLIRLIEKTIRYSHTSRKYSFPTERKYLGKSTFSLGLETDWENIIFWNLNLLAWVFVCYNFQ
jgi:hypothetical protein